MTDELLFSNFLITAFIGLISGSVTFLIIKGLTKNTNMSGALSIIFGVIISTVFFFNTLFDILNTHYQRFIDAAIIVTFYYRLDLCLAWIIATSLFWFSAKKYEKLKNIKR